MQSYQQLYGWLTFHCRRGSSNQRRLGYSNLINILDKETKTHTAFFEGWDWRGILSPEPATNQGKNHENEIILILRCRGSRPGSQRQPSRSASAVEHGPQL